MMKKLSTITLLAVLATSYCMSANAQQQDRSAIEHELAVTAYNYAVGCDERENWDEALIGLAHIPTGQLTPQQQAWADTLRMKCEAMAGHPMAANEIPLSEAEQLSLDDQSQAFINGIRLYQAGNYMEAGRCFNEVIDMGVGPRPQVEIEAWFWRGQCYFQIQMWEDCCKDIIHFNDNKTADSDPVICAMAYYTMGYARLNQKKWHHARLNFDRYLSNEKRTDAPTLADGKARLDQSRALENGKTVSKDVPQMTKMEPKAGEVLAIEELQMKHDTQQFREKQANATAIIQWKDWHAPYIEE